ncbi:CHASE domain-containing protein [Roseisolibacter sp. H3M3-2]|uniref:sensor histidine kinase n=1 Tax=Roseisolibacter sp. H3M3-2 TaxID=3031323 RepID=UPI0023DB70BB|nr:CHASE domain-containing protein [Roseisolibacter sp. H3M3-2]MDF1505400.1 CHASE domain-containing protein [Roseisolibacter sp. H3M3-2]
MTSPPAAPADDGAPHAARRGAARGVSAHAVLRAGAAAAAGPRGRRGSPLLVFLAGALCTLAVAVFVARSGRARTLARFDNAVRSTEERVRERLATHLALLHGAAALVAADSALDGDAFARYVATLDLPARYPGLRALGWAPRAAAPDGREAVAIAFLQPLDATNRGVVGYDMWGDPTRREAMARARDAAAPAITGPVVLRNAGDGAAGLLLYLPVYRGAAPADTAGRRAALAGFVYAAFRTQALFAGILDAAEAPRVALRVFDGADTLAPGALLVDSRGPDGRAGAPESPEVLRAVRAVAVWGRPWTFAFTDQPQEADPSRTALAVLIGVLGLGVSAALAALTRREVRARAHAEQSDAMRSRFFAAMSHELRTPINAILGYNDLILAGIYGPLPDAHADGIRRSQRAARHLHELVNDVLDLSKLEAGKVEVAPEPVRLDELLEDLMTTIRPLAEERGCRVELDRAPCALSIRTDPRRLRQILLNLLSNATKFGAGHPVRIACACLAHGDVPPGGRRRRTAGDAIVISVADGGPGIPPADQERIFEEFVQLPGASAGGTGLGLPISRRLAELLGGTLTLVSEPGAGSAFHVTLPRDDRRPARR